MPGRGRRQRAFLFVAAHYDTRPALSLSTSVSTSKKEHSPTARRASRRRRFRPFRLLLLLLIVAAIGLFEPHTFRFLLGRALKLEAWRHSITLHIDRIEGSILEPVSLIGSHWNYESRTGATTRIEIKEATAELSWKNLFRRGSARWFQRVTLDGVTGKINLPLEDAPAGHRSLVQRYIPHTFIAIAPQKVEALNVDFIFQTNGDYLRLQRARFTLSELEPGALSAGAVIVRHPWLVKTFRDVRGTTKLDGSTVEIARLAIEPGVSVERISAKLDDLARGRLDIVTQIAAFDGQIRVEAQTLPKVRPLTFDATTTFSQINVAKLTAFLALPNAAGGVIKDGKLNLRGSPQDFSKATATLRFEAVNFQWDARQMDSLVVGATLMAGRVQVPELALRQGHNQLSIAGEFALPAAGRKWWQDEFDARISATIDNLTELSALMLPQFTFAAGRATIDGRVHGKDEKFDGLLNVAGTNLQWRNAPIDELSAAIKLQGNELQVTSLSIFNDGDFIRGRGVVNILGPTQYWGVLNASVQDLATYSAILQKPIVPEPLAGGAVVDWSGEGSAKGHSGKFLARLKKVRSLGASAALLHPINADLEGTYAPGSMLFSRFTLSDDQSAFTANVAVASKSVRVENIRLTNKQRLWLEGDAVLPLDLWNAWPNTSLAKLLDDTTVSKVHLAAYDLSLREASQLTGWNFPIEGIVRGEITAEGVLGALQTSGKATLQRARIPLGWSGDALTAVEGAVSLAGQALQIDALTGRHPTGDFRASGLVDFSNLRDASLRLGVTSAQTELALFRERAAIKARLALQLELEGPVSSALVRGTAQIHGLSVGGFDVAAPWREPELPELPRAFGFDAAPFRAWRLDIAASTKPGGLDGAIEANVRIAGTGGEPALIGEVKFTNTSDSASRPVPSGTIMVELESATLLFREGLPRNPTLDLRANGSVFGEPFRAHAAGPITHLVRDIACAPPLSEATIHRLLAEPLIRAPAGEPRLSLRVPSIFAEGVEIHEWPEIETPPADGSGEAQ